MVSSISGPRGKQRLAFFGFFAVAIIIFFFTTMRGSTPTLGNNSCHTTRSLHTPPAQQVRKHTYLDLNNLNSTKFGKQAREHVLVLTTLQNDEQYMDNYFNLLDRSTYPNKLISIGLLVSDSTDGTMDEINFHVNRLQNRWSNRFYEIDVFQKDFQFEDRKDDTSLDSKRATMARARNFLLASALKEYHSWVAWIDVQLHSYPASIFSDLMLADSDVVVPNCLLYKEDGSFWAFDRNNWQETDNSLERQQQMPENQVLMEGSNYRLYYIDTASNSRHTYTYHFLVNRLQ
jgi:hypothetical protein